MRNYKFYPAYKDSGSEWLGAVPEHWEVKRLQYLCSNIKAGPFGSALTKDMYEREGFRVYGQEQVIPGDFSVGDYYIGSKLYSELRQYEVRAGDILISCVGTFGKIAVAPEGIEPGIINPRLIRVRVNDSVTSDYLTAVMRSSVVFEQFSHQSRGGTMDVINIGTLSGIVIVVPPRSEQAAVLCFLDRETGRIAALIEKKIRFIELLREKRQALITHAVTKGLDPTVKMKNSGVEWLGEVPEHWDVLSFQRCIFIAEGQVDPEASPYREMMLIAPNHIESGSGKILYTETAGEQNAESGKYLCQEGDVVYSKIRPALRKVCIAPEMGLCSADMYPMRGHSGMSNQFLFWFLLSEPFSAFAVLEADRVAMPKINRESLSSVQLPRPPLSEQMCIVASLELETTRLDNLRNQTERSIALLKERRSALITAAVTGQIDLREAG